MKFLETKTTLAMDNFPIISRRRRYPIRWLLLPYSNKVGMPQYLPFSLPPPPTLFSHSRKIGCPRHPRILCSTPLCSTVTSKYFLQLLQALFPPPQLLIRLRTRPFTLRPPIMPATHSSSHSLFPLARISSPPYSPTHIPTPTLPMTSLKMPFPPSFRHFLWKSHTPTAYPTQHLPTNSRRKRQRI